jgi:O-antigen/teichoic acid export membrane protein
MERRLVELRETTKIVRGAAAGFSSGLVFNLMSFGFYLAIVRLLPTDSLGVFYTLQLVMGFITTFGLLSLPSGVNRFVTGFVQTNRLEEARYLFRKGLTMAFLISIISLPVLVLLSSYLSYWFLGTTKYSLLFDLIAFDFVLIAFNSFFGVSLYAYRRFGRLGALQVAYGGFRYGGGVLFILLGLQVKAIILGWIASDLFRTFTYAYYSRPLLFGASLKNDLKKVFSFSLPYVIASGIVVALQNVDSLFVLKYLGVNALGVYGTLLNVSSIPQILPTSIGGSLMPAILKIEDSKGLSANVITNAIRYIALIVLPVFSLAAATGKPLIHIFLGEKFAIAWVSFAVLLIGHGVMSLDIPVNQVLVAKKKTKILAFQQVVSSGVLALLAVLLIPRFFLTGAALAYVLARVIGFLVTGPPVYKMGLLKVDIKSYVKILLTSVSVILSVLLVENLTQFAWWLLPLYLIIGSISGILMAKIVRLFNEDDYETIMDALPKELRLFAKYLWLKLDFPLPSSKKDA